MLVSIVIPAYNAEKTIARTLDSIKGIVEEDKDVEVIVVDNNSLDSTANIVKNYPFVKLIVSDACYVGGVRNTGIHQSQGVVIYNVDADCLVNKGSIKEIRDSLKDPNVGAVGGVYLKTNEPTWVENGYILVSDEGGFGEANDLPGGSLAFRREVYEKVGGFDEDVDAGEDSRFVRVIRRLGYRVLYLPSCSVVHLNNSKTIGQLVKRQMWHGSSYFRTTPLVLDKTFFATVLFILSIISGFLSLILGCHLIFLMSLAGLFFLIFVFSLKRAKYSLSLLLSNLFPALAVSFFYFLGRALGLIYGLIQFLFKFGESKSIRKL